MGREWCAGAAQGIARGSDAPVNTARARTAVGHGCVPRLPAAARSSFVGGCGERDRGGGCREERWPDPHHLLPAMAAALASGAREVVGVGEPVREW